MHYHPGKANIVADALSRKGHVNTLLTGELPQELAEDLRELCLEIVPRGYFSDIGDSVYLDGKDQRSSEDRQGD